MPYKRINNFLSIFITLNYLVFTDNSSYFKTINTDVFQLDPVLGFRVMVFNANFNNISVISGRSVLLFEEIGVPGENHRPVASHWQTLSHNVVSSGIRTHNISYDRY